MKDFEFWFTVISGFVAFLLQFAVLIWRASRMEGNIMEKMNSNRREMDAIVSNMKLELNAELAKIRLDYQKQIDSMALYIRDNYLEADTFDKIIKSHQDDTRAIFDRFETRFIRVEGKLDDIIRTQSRNQPAP